jgi:hypothetical protein
VAFDFASAGNSNAARIAMIAITTSNSISVKPLFDRFDLLALRPSDALVARPALAGRRREQVLRAVLPWIEFFPAGRRTCVPGQPQARQPRSENS